jgi:hypothetical protein
MKRFKDFGIISAPTRSSRHVNRSKRERSRTGAVLGSRVSVFKPEQGQAHAKRHRLGELCSRISRTSLATTQFEKNQILGPVLVPGGGRVPHSVPLYLGKLVTELD